MHARIESLLTAWGHFVVRRAWWVIAAVAVATLGLATQLQHFYIDASFEGFFRKEDPVRVLYDQFRDQYGRDSFVIVALDPKGSVFDMAFLETLREIHQRIENEVPLVVEVTSLWNARETRGVEDQLVVGELMEDWPESEAELRAIEARARANPLYRNNLISADGEVVVILIETEVYSQLGAKTDALEGFDDDPGDTGEESEAEAEPVYLTGAEDAMIVDSLISLLDEYRSPDLKIDLAGSPVLTVVFSSLMQRDMARFTALALLVIIVSLGTLFRRVGAVVLPIITVACAVVCTLSVMAATGTPLTSPTQIIPTFLLAVGVGGSVHILTIYYQSRRRGESKEDAIAHSLGHSGLAVIMTSLTTAGGLVSFIVAELKPIADFGAFAPVGVLMALFFTLTLLPALMAVSPGRTAGSTEPRPLYFSQSLLLKAGELAIARSTLIILVSALLFALSLTGVTRLRIAHSPLDWFPEGDMVREGMLTMNERMGGMGSFEVMVDTGHTNGFQEPELLSGIDALHGKIGEIRTSGLKAGKVLSLVDVVKETHRALNENRDEFYRVPDDADLVSQELLLFENAGSDDVEDLVDSQFSSGRISIRMPLRDAIVYPAFIADVVKAARAQLGPDVEVRVSGIIHVISATMSALIHTMIRSYIIALAIITPLMIVLIGSLRVGLISMIPNLLPVMMTLGLMGWLDIPLDAFTLLIGSIAIGLAVDDTIHFLHNFRRYYHEQGSPEEAIRSTMRSTGQALLFTSVVLAAGFAIYTQAYLTNLFYFGLLTSVTIVFAFLADILLAPAILVKVFGPRPVVGSVEAAEA